VQAVSEGMLENLVNLTNNILCFIDVILSFYCLSMVDTIKLDMKERCPLCNCISKEFYEDTQRYCRCPQCRAIFVVQEDLPKSDAEKERYELHDTDTEDEGYRKFVSPITNNIVKDFSKCDKGLDFGAGTSAIISSVLDKHGYKIKNYDPYFHNYPSLLQDQYDYISSCEVIEHLYHPSVEFKRLREMLREAGKLYLMTDIYDERDFKSWYYKNDPTHVFLYTKDTFTWIKENFGFKELYIEKRLVVLSL
jgi:hypothetical protein